MARKRWNIVNQHALRIYANRDRYAYLYGANGEVGSDALVDRLWAAYPSHFKAAVTDKGYTRQQLKDHVRGKICLDCSAFICYVTQMEDFGKLRVVNDYNSTGLRGCFAVKRTPVGGTAGSVLWKQGHVALDVGYGMCVDFGNEFLDCRLYPLDGCGFVESGELNFVDYTGTNAR